MNYLKPSLKEFTSYDLVDKDTVLRRARNLDLCNFLILIMVVLLIISGINIMSIMFFSVKERINEIGIKSPGATKIEILNQFIIGN